MLVPLVARIGAQVPGALFPGLPPVAGLDAEEVFVNYVRLIGIGGIFAAGLISIAQDEPGDRAGAAHGARRADAPGHGRRRRASLPRTDRDIPMGTVAVLTAVTAIAIGALLPLRRARRDAGRDLARRSIALALTLLISFLFAAVSAWAVAMISITPVSGMTLTTLIIAAVILARLGLAGGEGMLATLLIGGVVCTALSMTGSMVTLMKIGYWVGGTPRRIQWSLHRRRGARLDHGDGRDAAVRPHRRLRALRRPPEAVAGAAGQRDGGGGALDDGARPRRRGSSTGSAR